METIHYQCTLYWGWSSFHEKSIFHIYKRDDLFKALKSILISITRQYTFDCGQKDHPLNIWINKVEIVPIYEKETVSLNGDLPIYSEEYRILEFFNNEVKHTKTLVENNNLYKASDYNRKLAPENEEK